jgi:lipoprotein-anchoring transpeptidase ErfK/SrfK
MSRLHGLLLLSSLFLAGCAGVDSRIRDETIYIGGSRTTYNDPLRRSDQPGGREDGVSYWNGDGLSGSSSIKISLGEQRAYFYKGGKLAGISTVSTGREGFNTATGNFHIIQKDKDHVSSRFGDYVDANGNIIKKEIDTEKDPKPRGAQYDGARMPYFMRIVGGTGMHAGYLPGYPASHGCIRMPGFMAEKFFENVTVGTPVTVTE